MSLQGATFLVGFLPLSVVVFVVLSRYVGNTAANVWLVLASLAFYFQVEPRFCVLLIASVALNFWLGRSLRLSSSVTLLRVGIIFNIAVLAAFKYAPFLAGSSQRWANVLGEFGWAVPVGLSFYTFQQIAYLVDLYRNDVERHSFLGYCNLILFFPKLLAGPLVDSNRTLAQFATSRELRSNNIKVGAALLLLGLFKKLYIAAAVAPYARASFQTPASLSLLDAWVGAAAYGLEIYFDFSGYSDMAVGIALMFNIKLPVNFNSPYKADSIVDFWHRWHISLTRFLTDYVYFVLPGHRKSRGSRYLNLFFTMLVCGIWHGSGIVFVVWGALHGGYLILNHAWIEFLRRSNLRFPSHVLYRPICRLLTIGAVLFGWAIFGSADLRSAGQFVAAMVGAHGIQLPTPMVLWGVVMVLFVGLIACVGPNSQQWIAGSGLLLNSIGYKGSLRWRPTVLNAAALGAIAFMVVKTFFQAAQTQFLYFKF